MDKQTILNILHEIYIDQSTRLTNHQVFKNIDCDGEVINLELSVSNPTLQFKNKIKSQIDQAVLSKFPKARISINFIVEGEEVFNPIANVKNIIAIASGKGGVGKSTVSSNLAIALKKEGYSVGLIDADIYGPSIPLMFDAENERPKLVNKNNDSLMSPVVSYGVKIMSIGFFAKKSDAMVWRGPMATKALKQIINQTDWGNLDYLLIDLPPGTSDIHLSLVQTLSLTGSLIVTTPQTVALIDAIKAINMFKMNTINVPIIGLVENMSWCLVDDKKHYFFGRDGGKNLSKSENVSLLAEIPLNKSIREAGDVGRPAALQDSELGYMFTDLAKKVVLKTNFRNQDLPQTKKVKITHNRGCN